MLLDVHTLNSTPQYLRRLLMIPYLPAMTAHHQQRPCTRTTRVDCLVHTWHVAQLFFVQVEAVTPLTVLALARGTFLSVLGPLEELLKREKSPQVLQGLQDQIQLQDLQVQPQSAHPPHLHVLLGCF